MKTTPQTTRDEWRCRTCGTLFGVAENGRIEIRYKSAAYIINGKLSTRCRRCNTPSEYDTRKQTQPVCSA